MVTSNDVAREAGVSQATVSRVLTPGGRVSVAARTRVLDAMERIGYVPNVSAQALKTGRSGTIGVVVADLANPFYPQLLDALSSVFDQAGYRVTVWISDGHKNDAALQGIREGSVDGVAFTTVTRHSEELSSALERRSPLVLVNRMLPGVDCDQVASDNVAGAQLIADHFVQGGRTKTAFIGGTKLASTSHSRLNGFARRMAQTGHPLLLDHVSHGEYTYDDGYRAMLDLLKIDSEIDAVFCGNDILGFGALDALRSTGRRVPQDVWVAGYDDTDMASWGAFNLTTVRQDTTELARVSAELLFSRIADPQRAIERRELAPQLIVRRSTSHEGEN